MSNHCIVKIGEAEYKVQPPVADLIVALAKQRDNKDLQVASALICKNNMRVALSKSVERISYPTAINLAELIIVYGACKKRDDQLIGND